MSQCTGLSVIIVILSALVGLFFFPTMSRMIDLAFDGLKYAALTLSLIRSDARPKKYTFLVVKKARVSYGGQINVTYHVMRKRWRFSVGDEMSSHTKFENAVAAAIEYRELMLTSLMHYERDAVVFRAGIDIPQP